MSESTDFKLLYNKALAAYNEAKALGVVTRPVVLGPISYLVLGKAAKEASATFQPISLLPKILPVYKQLLSELKAAGVTHDVITVPGALEIPAAIAIALDAAENNGKPYDAAIALGCVVRGDTIHFEIVSIESSRALMDLAVARKFPLGNGIITVNTEAQAWARARASELNKGGDAARAALAMLRIKRRPGHA